MSEAVSSSPSAPAGASASRTTIAAMREARREKQRKLLERLIKHGIVDRTVVPTALGLEELERLLAREEAHDLFAALLEAETSDGSRRILTMGEFRRLPTPGWLVRGVFPGYGIGQLVGPSDSFKSFHAIHLALSIANNRPTWFGSHIERCGHVLYVAMEGGFDLTDRIDAWLEEHPGTTDNNLRVMVEKGLDLGSKVSVNRLRREMRSLHVNPRLIVVDTQGLATAGREEDNAVVMNQVLGVCKALAKDFECFLLLVHHTGYDVTRERGSSAQKQAVDLSMLIKESSVLQFRKVKAGPRKADVHFEMVPVGPSLVVRELTGSALLAATSSRAVALKRSIVDYVELHPWSSKSTVAAAIGGTKATVLAEITDLLDDGVLTNEGTPSNTKLVVTES